MLLTAKIIRRCCSPVTGTSSRILQAYPDTEHLYFSAQTPLPCHARAGPRCPAAAASAQAADGLGPCSPAPDSPDNLGGNSLNKDGATLLARALPYLTALQTLGLTDNNFADKGEEEGLAALTAALPTGLQALDLSRTFVDGVGALVLAQALPRLSSLTRLGASQGEEVGSAGAVALAGSLSALGRLQELQLGQAMTGRLEGGIAALVQSLPHLTALQSLSLPNLCCLFESPEEDMVLLARSL
jgi:hypothetical protein